MRDNAPGSIHAAKSSVPGTSAKCVSGPSNHFVFRSLIELPIVELARACTVTTKQNAGKWRRMCQEIALEDGRTGTRYKRQKILFLSILLDIGPVSVENRGQTFLCTFDTVFAAKQNCLENRSLHQKFLSFLFHFGPNVQILNSRAQQHKIST